MILMDIVKLPREDAVRLITDKLREIDNRIQKILQLWNQPSTEVFLERTRTGDLEDAEIDAITLTNLIEERDRISHLYDQL